MYSIDWKGYLDFNSDTSEDFNNDKNQGVRSFSDAFNKIEPTEIKN